MYCCEQHRLQETKRADDSGLTGGSGGDPLQNKKNAAITEIENSLNQPPPITNNQLESTNQSWRIKIQNANLDSDIITIKDQVLADIASKRQAKDPLAELRKTAIDKILDELTKEPPVDENNYQNLENIYQQIKELRSSNAYQDYVAEIQTVEDRLKELNPDEFQGMTESRLKQMKQKHQLTDSDLDKDTNEAIAEAIQNPTSDNIRKAEDGIEFCGARKELTGLLGQNDFTKKAYREKKQTVDELLQKLEESDPQKQQQNPEFP
nr:9077_t:CDS:2 [Entrophospora candida]